MASGRQRATLNWISPHEALELRFPPKQKGNDEEDKEHSEEDFCKSFGRGCDP